MANSNFRPAKRSLGQNFLIDERVIGRIVESLGEINNVDVVEIGPGRGALTQRLITAGSKLTVIEKDTSLAEDWRRESSVDAIEADFLDVDPANLPPGARLIGNLPYNISTAILERVAECRERFPVAVFMFQREVAERIVAPPSTSERGYLSVVSQAAFAIERLFDVAPEAFRPRPKVWSTVVRFTPRPQSEMDEAGFRRLVSLSFQQRRKTLTNNLKQYYQGLEESLQTIGVDGRRRAESLELEEWLRLYRAIKSFPA
jgi:16S rRNA (adenine1518-N6/adenine1519-N6)-dimethyltransferase